MEPFAKGINACKGVANPVQVPMVWVVDSALEVLESVWLSWEAKDWRLA